MNEQCCKLEYKAAGATGGSIGVDWPEMGNIEQEQERLVIIGQLQAFPSLFIVRQTGVGLKLPTLSFLLRARNEYCTTRSAFSGSV